jgi:starvation-inducible DNA-binding protein
MQVKAMSKVRTLEPRRKAMDALDTPTDLSEDAVRELSTALNAILADSFALYLKTKNFHWHVSGPHFRDYHLLLDEQGEQIFATTDELAERVRKIGGTTLRSIGDIAKLQSIKDNDETFVPPLDMLRELMNDNKAVAHAMREACELAEKHHDLGTTNLLEAFIDATEKRTWFLFEASRPADQTGH